MGKRIMNLDFFMELTKPITTKFGVEYESVAVLQFTRLFMKVFKGPPRYAGTRPPAMVFYSDEEEGMLHVFGDPRWWSPPENLRESRPYSRRSLFSAYLSDPKCIEGIIEEIEREFNK